MAFPKCLLVSVGFCELNSHTLGQVQQGSMLINSILEGHSPRVRWQLEIELRKIKFSFLIDSVASGDGCITARQVSLQKSFALKVVKY